jgi:hypothetical protein
MTRAQSHVIGVALLLGISVVALGGLTLAVGSVVDSQTASADATRVADGMASALQPAATTGRRSGTVRFADGTLSTAERDLRVRRNGTRVATVGVDALVFESGDRRVTFLAGAVVRGHSDNAWFRTDPLVTASEQTGVVAVGAPRLGSDRIARSASGPTALTLGTNVSHTRRTLGSGRYTVALETTTTGPFARHFREHNASVATRDIDGDGVPSVVATYSGVRTGYLVVHDLSLEVANG